MAFQDVNVGNTKKATAMKVGEAIEGYAVRIEESTKHEGQFNLVMKDKKTGETYLLFSAGNLRYILADGKVTVGLLTRIERIADKNVKGKNSSQFRVQQDEDDTIESVSASGEIAEEEDTKFNALGGAPAPGDVRGSTVERSIKKRAEQLASANGRK